MKKAFILTFLMLALGHGVLWACKSDDDCVGGQKCVGAKDFSNGECAFVDPACAEIPIAERAQCLFSLAVNTNDAAICDQLTDFAEGGHTYMVRGQCFSAIGVEAGDLSFCVRILDKEGQHACIRKIAQAKRDIDICSQLDEPADCIASVAVAVKNPEDCDHIDHPDLRRQCRLDVEDVCALSSQESCQQVSDCEWRSLGGAEGENYTCCPFNRAMSPSRCKIDID